MVVEYTLRHNPNEWLILKNKNNGVGVLSGTDSIYNFCLNFLNLVLVPLFVGKMW